ncbi:anti sigma factor C-terminal domain-containing protein [Brevibacillus gelatini]|uniref:anti sigma factor C-terminal domain-containing protein n=1 Tax=Brevibacillus gelatini TaxID=1655277 RepID=UPI003D819F3D
MEDDKLRDRLDVSEVAWDEKKARRLIWRSRFALWKNIAQTLLAIWFFYTLYMIVIQIGYAKLNKEDDLVRYASTLIETHYAGLMVDKSGHTPVSLSPWLTQETTLTLYKQLGKWEEIVGTVTVKKPLWGKLEYEIHYQKKQLDDRDGTFRFALPLSLLGQKPLDERKEQDELWEQLAHMEDGYVAEMAFSTLQPYEPMQLYKLLEKYDLYLLQMAVYGGELKTFKPTHTRSESTVYVPNLVLRPAVHYSEGGSMSLEKAMSLPESVEDAKNQLIPDLEWMQSYAPDTFDAYDEKRLTYLREKGIVVYGAVVTGPVRELEKLRAETGLHEFQLGRIAVWNW